MTALMPAADRLMRCAIYTRKSVATGLEKPINSIETQRDVCGAYIRSQAHRHWVEMPQRYDDGGFSGGTLERPALQRLIDDIEAGQVDIIVIYKVDRLSRSLTDFVRLMDVLNRYGASFVSVTQTFDTSDSMGRLILNILLTFAQFERELASERIRDRCAARRKRGLFAGGMPPIGYLVKKSGRLVPDPERAAHVAALFRDYVTLSANQLGQRLEAQGFRTRSFASRHKGQQAQRFPAANVLKILRNPIYAGYFMHKGELVQAQVEPLTSLEQWKKVQQIILTRHPCRRDPVANLLVGLLHDETGRRMTIVKGAGGRKRPRYYRSDAATWARGQSVQKVHVNADHVEELALATISDFLQDRRRLREAILTLGHYSEATARLLSGGSLAARRIALMDRPQLRELLVALVSRLDVNRTHLRILLCVYELQRLLGWDGKALFRRASVRPKGADRFQMLYAPASLICTKPDFAMPVRAAVPQTAANRNGRLVDMLVQAVELRQFMLDHRDCSLAELARRRKMGTKTFARFLRVNYLAPDIQASIIDGTQPQGLTRNAILFGPQPLDWDQQRRLYGFAPLEIR